MQQREQYPHLEGDSWMRRLKAALADGEITPADCALLESYIDYKNIRENITSKRKRKLIQHLILFRRDWSKVPFAELTADIWMSAASKILGSGYAQNTKSDYIAIMKGFLKWGIKRKHFHFSTEDVDEVRTPRQQAITKAPEDLITDDEAYQMILHPDTDPMMAALIAVLYFTGPRIGEACALQWKDLIFKDMQLGIRITDTKAGKQRYASSCEALEFVSAWRTRYPDINGGPNGENFVFISRGPQGKKVWQQLSVANARARIELIGKNVLGRHIHPHLFRTSNITNLAAKGVPDSVNKEMHWGNQATLRMKTYCLLKNSQIDDAMYAMAGIEHGEEVEAPTGPIQCVHCRTMNIPRSSYCRFCGMPLTASARDKQQILREAANAAKAERSFADMKKDAAAYLDITIEELDKLLGL